jgi:short-subunit dehydrogenase
MVMPIVLITGASSGIGLEFAKLFAKDRYELILLARNESALKTLAQELNLKYQTKVTVIAKDLSKPEAVDELISSLNDKQIVIDVLINNAGYANSGSFAATSLQNDLDMLMVNNLSLVALCKAFLPTMLKHGQGQIVNVSSVAAFQPGPFMALYAASKAFVLSFSAALSEELRNTGVRVTTICPGPTLTSFISRSGMGHTRIFNGFYPLMSAEKVALKSYKALQRGANVYIVGTFNRLVVVTVSILPRKVGLWFLRFLQNQ